MLNTQETREEFVKLLTDTCDSMNTGVYDNLKFYRENSGKRMENIVVSELQAHAKGTIFENKIRLANSDRDFPDIIVGEIYGIEVKTSNSGWKSVGSSIMESTRIPGVESIFMFFGNLGWNNPGFRVKPYEDSLSHIAVTHSPRYSINMELSEGNTIFEKMDIPYDAFRNHSSPTDVLKEYYRSHLSEGQTLWWMGTNETTTSPILTMWSALEKKEQQRFIVSGFCFFPELIAGDTKTKYNRMSFWLVTNFGVIPHALRDKFSSGGRVNFKIDGNEYKNKNRVYYILSYYVEHVKSAILSAEIEELKERWNIHQIHIGEDRIRQWIDLVISHGSAEVELLYDLFKIDQKY